MARLVLKFGGTSVRDIERIEIAAQKIKSEWERGHEIAVVVSAMAGETDRLVGLCRDISPLYDAREYDSVVAAGEQISSGLLALALQKIEVPARSWLGWQLPVLTTEHHAHALIRSIDVKEIARRMTHDREVAVIAGFQGLTEVRQRITTIGRGGGDSSGVAVAAALEADRCDIYTDVDGVYTTDPRIVPEARKVDCITHEEMLELASQGAKVLHARSVALAIRSGVQVQVLSSYQDHIGSHLPGTLVISEADRQKLPQGRKQMEERTVTGIALDRNDVKISLRHVPDRPGIAAHVFGPLSKASINVDMISQSISGEDVTDMTFTVSKTDHERAIFALESNQENIGYNRLESDENIVKVSVVGVGMRSHAGVAQTMFQTLADRGVNLQVIATSEIKISALISAEYGELAVRALHAAYQLEKAQ